MNYAEVPNEEAESWRVEEREDLRVRTKRFALQAIRMFTALSDSPVTRVIGRQVLRSATSVGANYRETHRARSDAEFIAKLGDCLKELEETLYWFELLDESGALPTGKLAGLMREANEPLAILTTIAKNLKAKPRPSSLV